MGSRCFAGRCVARALRGSAGLSSFSKDLRPFIHMVEYTCTSCLRRTSSRIQSRQWKAWSASARPVSCRFCESAFVSVTTTEKTPAQVRAFDAVDAQDAAGHQSTLITVGARLYPSLAKKHGLRSYQCSHATGLFAYKIRRGRRPALMCKCMCLATLFQMNFSHVLRVRAQSAVSPFLIKLGLGPKQTTAIHVAFQSTFAVERFSKAGQARFPPHVFKLFGIAPVHLGTTSAWLLTSAGNCGWSCTRCTHSLLDLNTTAGCSKT